jgi:hypothetical protein
MIKKMRLYRAVIGKEGYKEKNPAPGLEKDIYIAADTLPEAVAKVQDELAADEEIALLREESEECYV